MSPELKYKLEKCGRLLAQSPLEQKIKQAILDNISRMSELELDEIIMSLERETIELSALERKIREFEEKQDSDWRELEKKQQEAADSLIEKTLSQSK